MEEVLFHPETFKTTICSEQPRGRKRNKCHRYYCPFAHGEQELRESKYSTEQLEAFYQALAEVFHSDTCCQFCTPPPPPALSSLRTAVQTVEGHAQRQKAAFTMMQQQVAAQLPSVSVAAAYQMSQLARGHGLGMFDPGLANHSLDLQQMTFIDPMLTDPVAKQRSSAMNGHYQQPELDLRKQALAKQTMPSLEQQTPQQPAYDPAYIHIGIDGTCQVGTDGNRLQNGAPHVRRPQDGAPHKGALHKDPPQIFMV
jgi:hypothetical protein